MDDDEYYATMRKQYSPTEVINKLSTQKKYVNGKLLNKKNATSRQYTEWNIEHGREDAEMLNEDKSTSRE